MKKIILLTMMLFTLSVTPQQNTIKPRTLYKWNVSLDNGDKASGWTYTMKDAEKSINLFSKGGKINKRSIEVKKVYVKYKSKKRSN